MFLTTRRGVCALAFTGLGAILAGCGGSSNTNPNAGHIRVVNFSANGGSQADVLVNSESAYGDLPYGTPSPYLYINGATNSTFSDTTNATVPQIGDCASVTSVNKVSEPAIVNNATLNNSTSYTALLIGRSDVQPLSSDCGADGKTPTAVPDPRFLQTIVLTDPAGVGSGQAVIRAVNAAPDVNSVDILVNNNTILSGVAYPQAGANLSSNALLTPATVQETPGTLSVQIIDHNTHAVIVPATSVPVTGGKSYTLVITETIASTGATPTYSLATLTP